MKVKTEKLELTFKCTNYGEYIKFLEVLDRLATCWCNKRVSGCKDCMLRSVVDENDNDLCDIFTDIYNRAL